MVGTRVRLMACMIFISLVAVSFAQYGQYSQRSLLEKKIYYIADGKIGTADYWSLPLGKLDCKLRRYFPGEDTVSVDAAINFSLLSSGYVEGSGYGTRGKTMAEGQLAIQDGDTLKLLEMGDIDYVCQGGAMVKPAKSAACPLILHCEGTQGAVRRMQVMIWIYDKVYKELKHSKDVEMVTAFSFTKEGIQRALNAAK